MEQAFNRSHVKAILKPYLRADDDFTTDEPSDDPATKDCEPIERCKRFKIDRHGVWPLDETDVTDREMSEFGQWRPVSVFLDGPDEQDVVGTPMLPFPFTARDLAAFMAYGVGVLVAEHYGDWADGPDPDRLNDIPKHENFARLAVKSAFDAYREAERAVDAYPLALIAKAHLACDAFNKATTEANMREGVSGSIPGTDDSRDGRARAVASVVQQDTEMEAANKEARTAHEAWLNAMVRELLQPAPTQTVTPAPVALVEPASDDRTPLPMNQVANCFAEFHGWNVARWKAELGSPDIWLVACRHTSGTRGRGGSESTWWPLKIAAALMKMDEKSERSLRSLFKRSKPLEPWSEQFQINYPIDTDSL